jgi:FkbM family methyltransferase
MRSVVLPNDLKIYAPSEIEARTLYREIFTERAYSSNGISVTDGDCVFDVGANIGLFSIFLSRSYRGLKLFAFEPVRQTFALLEKNAGLHLNGPAGSQAKLFNFGLSDRNGTALFEYDRFMGLAATMYPREVRACARRDAGMRAWAEACVLDLRRISKLSDGQADFLLKALSKPAVGSLAAAIIIAFLIGLMARNQILLERTECPLRTVSEVIRENNVGAIDLMKIDVEGSELDVIRGIATEDWPKIRQFVVEAHDIDGRVELLKSIFENHGYRTTVGQEDWAVHKLTNIFTIYAVRD